MLFRSFLLSFRIKDPIGESANTPYLEGKSLVDKLKKSKKSVVFFIENSARLSYADFAIRKFKKDIDFFRSSASEGQNYNCTEFPCAIAFEKGKTMPMNFGPYQPVQFLTWVESILTPGIMNVKTPELLRSLLEGMSPIIFGVDIKERPKDFPKEQQILSVSSDLFNFFNISVKKGIYYYRPADRELIDFKSVKKTEDLNTPITDMVTCSSENTTYFGGYFINTDNDETTKKEIEILKKVAPKFKNSVSLAIFYGDSQSKILEKADINLDAPFFFILERSDIEGGRWVINDARLHDAAAIEKFLTGIIDGTEEYSVISEPVENYTGVAFKKVVGSNFEELVINNKEDVLIAFTAPWCHHCKEFKPVLNEVAKLIENTNSRVYFIDATANDLPEAVPEINGYPTLYYWPASNKSEPIQYNGERTVKAVLEFLSEHASTTFEMPKYDEAAVQAVIDEKLKEID